MRLAEGRGPDQGGHLAGGRLQAGDAGDHLLGGGYGRVVLRPGQLLGQEFSQVVARATMAVAAVFQLARRPHQRVVDRRFHRRRYDAGQTTSTWLESERITSPKENR
jgi:hypothetical protein